jgi:leucyl aminopeptidase
LTVTIDFVLEREVPSDASVVAIGIDTGQMTAAGPSTGATDRPDALAPEHRAFAVARGFTGTLGQIAAIPGVEGGPTTLLVGLGPSDDVGPGAIRRAAGALARACRRDRVVAVRLLDAISTPSHRPPAAQALAEGIVLGSYRFTTYKSDREPSAIAKIVVIGSGGRRILDALELGRTIARGVSLARDLVNTPGGDLTPTKLADAAVDVAKREGLEVSVLDEKAIVKAGLGGLLGVNRGSTQPPRFIEISYTPPTVRGSLALVGKGITFDSGGLSLKTAQGMTTMKNDMGGAAAIIGAMSVIQAVGPKVKITGYIPTTDNMTGGDATRVGDVLRIRNGKSVEVLNTDAEGRLILADGLSIASESKPDAIVDLATLTGAAVVALGSAVAGMFGSNESWIDQVMVAAERTGEQVWHLPMVDDYRAHLDSDVADLKNIGKPAEAGAIIAALFLREFVADDIPWVHLDIAGTAWSDRDELDVSKGGTGWGVRLLVELARNFHRPGRQ